jgi:translation initiation factor 1
MADVSPRQGTLQVAPPSRVAHDRVVADRDNARVVYSTGTGRLCPGCGWPQADCKCSQRTGRESVPAKIVAKLRVEKKGRGGKTVTVVYDLPRNDDFLKELSQELKRGCGTGGSTSEATVELQGDVRDRVRELLTKKGYVVKG